MATKTKKKKRTMSALQKAALAKGRAALKLKRNKKYSEPKKKRKKVVKNKTPLIALPFQETLPKRNKSISTKNKGGNMAKRKESRRSEGKSKAVTKARNFVKKAGLVETLQDTAVLVGGGVLSALVVNKIPIQDARVKSAIPIVAGLGIAGLFGEKRPLVRAVGKGMMAVGLISLFKKLAPNVPMLAGEQIYYLPSRTGNYLPNYSGGVDLSGVVDMGMGFENNYVTAANM